ncbi:TolC family protein [uncultured Gimesia sp.]|uniref:TolC family protein n=1 Tax=uncultured Gimesia sp. TaxID=1678688 RepID=UPI0030DA3FF8
MELEEYKAHSKSQSSTDITPLASPPYAEDISTKTVGQLDPADDTEFILTSDLSNKTDSNATLDTLIQTTFNPNSTAIPPAPGVGSDQTATEKTVAPHTTTVALTVEELLQLAMENNPTLQQATAVINKAQGIKKQVGLYPNPTVGYQGQEMGANGTSGKQGGYISQTIVTGNKLSLNQAVADYDVQQLQWELETQKYRVRNDVQSQFFASLGAEQRIKLSLQLEKIAEEGVEMASKLFESGEAARPDILQAEVQLGEIRIIRQNAEYDHEAARKQLASLVGRPELTQAPLRGILNEKSTDLTWEGSYQKLQTNSPELQAAYARVSRAREQIYRQESQIKPNLLAQIGVARDNETGDDIANVQLGIPLPIFNRNQGNIDMAGAEYHRSLGDVERLQLSLQVRLANAFRNYQKAEKQVEQYQQNILPKAKENLDLTNQGYQQQQFDFLRVLTARRTYFEMNIKFIRSLVDLRQSEVAISGLVLSGGLSEVRDISQGVGGVGNRGQALSGQ